MNRAEINKLIVKKDETATKVFLADLAKRTGKSIVVLIDGEPYEVINEYIEEEVAKLEAKKARQDAFKAEFEATKVEAKPVRDYAAEIEAIKADTSLTNTEKAAVAIAKIKAEEVAARFETEPDASTPWFEMVQPPSEFDRPVRQYLRPGTKAEVAKLKKVLHIDEYRHQLRALLGEIE